MITGITLENFKGVRDRVEIELRPVTLLFGANSAGKSTILHALHYAREIFERHNLDADQTISGGSYVDLGGFKQIIHKGDLSEKMKLGITIEIEDPELPSFAPPLPPFLLLSNYPPPLITAKTAHVELTISWSESLSQPFIEEYEVLIDGELIANISAVPGRKLKSLNLFLDHSSLTSSDEAGDYFQVEYSRDDYGNYSTALREILIKAINHNAISGKIYWYGNEQPEEEWVDLEIPGDVDALPNFDREIVLEFDSFKNFDEWEVNELRKHYLQEAISQIVVGTGLLIRDQLCDFRYLGPLRETPSRNYHPPRFSDDSRWSSGLGAWDELQNGSEDFILNVGDWLGDEDKLNCGYSIEKRNFKEINLSDPLIRNLLTGRAFDESEHGSKLEFDNIPTQSRIVIIPKDSDLELRPHDVGIGISQVVPVVVTALHGQNRLMAIEQPELHLHPKLQAELADLFIEAAMGDRHHFIILETHSELIPLRIMRRIRECYDKDESASSNAITPRDVAIYYIESYKGATATTLLELSKRGQLLDPWPDGFFEEGFRERFTD